MSYLYDDPIPVLILLGGIAVVCFLVGSARGRTAGLIAIGLGVGLFFLEQALVSEGEIVEMEVSTMLDNFKSQNLSAITRQISKQHQDLVATAEKGLNMVELGESFSLKSVEVTFDSESKATALVRANGEVSLKQGGGQHRIPNYWRTVWLKEGESWKLSDATRLNPVNGTEMGTFSAN